MREDYLPRPVVKFLAGLPPEHREALAPLLALLHQAILQGADKAQVLEMLDANPLSAPDAELALPEALARLAHPAMPTILQTRFGGASDKYRQKVLKKAFHHLKAQGVEIPPDLIKPEESPVPQSLPSGPPIKGYLSRIEGNGSRLVILHLPRQGQAFTLFLALCNDTEGLKDTYAVLLSNKETKKYLHSTRQDIPGELVEVPPVYAFNILEDSYQANPDPSSKSVANYLRVKSTLQERLGHLPASDLQALVPPLDHREQYLEQSRNLSLEEDFLNWHFNPEELGPWLEKINQIEQSPLVLTPDQKVARIENVVDEAIKDLFPAERRHLLSRRLLEMAYYLEHTGRPHLARQAQAAGEDLDRKRGLLERENLFLLGLVMFPLRELYDREKEPKSPPPESQGRIITDF
jgi:hypothetical protein